MSSPPPSPPSPARPAKSAPPNPMRSARLWVTLAIVLLANVVITNVLFAPAQPTTVTLPYDVFKQQVVADNVLSVTTTGDAITGVTKTPVKESPTSTVSATHFTTQHPSFANDGLELLLEQHNVTINAKPENPPPPFWETLLFSFGPTLLIVIAVLYLIHRAARNRQDIARSRRGRGGEGALLQPVGVGVRGGHRRRRRISRSRSVYQGAVSRARDHFHRRARRHRAQPQLRLSHRRQRRAGADAQPDPHRDGWLRARERRHRPGRHQPGRCSRSGPPTAGSFRSPCHSAGARPPRPRGDSEDSHRQGAAGAGRRPGRDRRRHTWTRGRRSQKPCQRGGPRRGSQGRNDGVIQRFFRGHR